MVIVVIVGILGNVWGIFESFKVYWMIIIRIEFESGYKMGMMWGGLCDWGGGFGGKVESKFEKIWLKM